MEKKIGTATLKYNDSGIITYSEFKPEIFVSYKNLNVAAKLSEIRHRSEEEIKSEAEKVFSLWFSHLNEIELADREEFKIETRITNCEKAGDGAIQSCSIEFYLIKLN